MYGQLTSPKFNVECSTLQKDIKHYYKAKIISKKLVMAFLFLVMLVVSVEVELVHNFCFCHNNQNCRVKNMGNKYAVSRLVVPSIWAM